ncbi:MAG: nucleoside-diphosphate sugar epimerase, partial [bacterium]
DAVDGVMLAMERFQGAKNEVYNIAFGEGRTLVEVAERIQQRLEVNKGIRIENTRTGEVVKYIADTSKARDKLNFAPKVPLSEGVKKAVDWYQEHIPA